MWSADERRTGPERGRGKSQTYTYRIARKFRRVKYSQKLIRLSFRDFIFADSNPILINDVTIVSQIKIFAGRDKSVKTANFTTRNFLAIQYA